MTTTEITELRKLLADATPGRLSQHHRLKLAHAAVNALPGLLDAAAQRDELLAALKLCVNADECTGGVKSLKQQSSIVNARAAIAKVEGK
jgi:hypothetical protein